MGYLKDGYPFEITSSLKPSIKLRPKNLKPYGIDAGGGVNTTTASNTRWHTQYPKTLIKGTNITFESAFDPAVIDDVLDIIGVNQLWTITYSDGSEDDVWGWLDKFDRTNMTEGNQPTANCTVELSNQDNSDNEVAPVHRDPP
jgi:hypothetical protein